MSIFRISAIVGVLSLAAPGAAFAASAGFFAGIGGTLTIDAPGATIVPDGFVLPNGIETGTGVLQVVPAYDPSAISASAVLTGSADAPFGIAEAAVFAALVFDVINETSAPVVAMLEWDIEAATDADASGSPSFFVDAYGFATADLYAHVGTVADPEDTSPALAFVEAETDPFLGLVGPDLDTDAGSRSFTIGVGQTLFIEAFGYADGAAVVLPVPVPASLGLVLTGLAGLGALHLRRG